MQAGQGPHRPRLQWIEAGGALEGRQGVGETALALHGMAQEAEGVGVVWVEPHRLRQGCGCFRQGAALERLHPLQPLLIGRAVDAQAPVPGRQLAQARQGGQRAIRRLLEQRFNRAFRRPGAPRQIPVDGQAGGSVLGQAPLTGHQGVGGGGDRLPQRRLVHQPIELADQILGVVVEQRRTGAGEMPVGIEIL